MTLARGHLKAKKAPTEPKNRRIQSTSPTHLTNKKKKSKSKQPTDLTATGSRRGQEIVGFKRITYKYVKQEYWEFRYEILKKKNPTLGFERVVQPLLLQSFW